MKVSNEKTTIYLDPKIKKSVQYYALRDDRSLSALINERLVEYLEDMADITALQDARNSKDEFVIFEKFVEDLGLNVDEIRSKAQVERQKTIKKSR
jgi:predicted DNA-binding protein